MAHKTDAQTTNEEQNRAGGTKPLTGSAYEPHGVDLLSGKRKLEFDWAETVHGFEFDGELITSEPRAQDRLK